MHGKEFAIDFIRTYFTVVALIDAVMFIMGMQAAPERQFGYEAFAVPLIYGAAGTLPNVVMYSKRELSVKELLVRKVLQFILIEVLVLFAVFYGTDIYWKQPQLILDVAISILLVYVIASVIDWIQNCISAKQMTEELMRLQQSVRG